MTTPATYLISLWEFLVLLFHASYLWPWGIIKFFLPQKQKDVTGEIIFITGAGSGLGRGMSLKFARYGATIICTDINKESSDETMKMIKKNGDKAYSYQLDVTDRTKVYELAEKIRSEIGDVTMLVNNAGIVTGRNMMDCPDDSILKTMEVNTISHFWTLKAFLGPMIKNNQGHVVTIASIAGHSGSPQMVDYCASKYGAIGLHESLQIELFEVADNVKTTSVCPWVINTGMFEGMVSKSPLTLPMLDHNETVNRIVAGVLNEEEQIFIPGKLMIFVFLKALLPLTLQRKLVSYMKLHEQMTGFVGRREKKKE